MGSASNLNIDDELVCVNGHVCGNSLAIFNQNKPTSTQMLFLLAPLFTSFPS